MKNTNVPLFSLATTSEFVVVAGGGGSREYGKENGILLIAKSKLGSENDDVDDFFKTEDLIKAIDVYEEGEECEDYEVDDLSLDHEESDDLESIPEIDSSPEAIEVDSEKPGAVEISGEDQGYGSDDDSSEAENSARKESAGGKSNDLLAKDKKNTEKRFFVAAVGDEYFYYLKYDGKLKLLKKLKHQVKDVILTKHLFILYRKNVSGFYDIEKNIESLRLRSRIIEEAVDQSNEEYFYKLYKKDEKIVYKREDGLAEVPRNWDGFFIHDHKIHKIISDADGTSFVYRNRKYSFEGRISKVIQNKVVLAFYVNREADSHLYFINEREKIYQLPRLTSISSRGNLVAVSTCTGDVVVYRNGEFLSRRHVADLPITGISIDNGNVYFSVLNGIVDKAPIRPSRIFIGLLMALIMVFIAVFIANRKK